MSNFIGVGNRLINMDKVAAVRRIPEPYPLDQVEVIFIFLGKEGEPYQEIFFGDEAEILFSRMVDVLKGNGTYIEVA